MVGVLIEGLRCSMSWFDISLTFDLVSVIVVLLLHLIHISSTTKLYGLLELIILCMLM